MEQIRDQYHELKSTMATFQLGLSEALAKAESEFLQAYRAHMLEVHRELQALRAKLSEAETSILSDDQIQQLEKDGAWYRNEAAQQTAFVAVMEKDRAYMVQKMESLDADRQTLARQLKAAKKHQKLLRAELKLRHTSQRQQKRYDDADAAAALQAAQKILASSTSSKRRLLQLEHKKSINNNTTTTGGAAAPSSSSSWTPLLDNKAWLSSDSRPPSSGASRTTTPILHRPGTLVTLLGPFGDDRAICKELDRELRVARRETAELRRVLVSDRSRMSDFADFYKAGVRDYRRHAKRPGADPSDAPADPDQLAAITDFLFPAPEPAGPIYTAPPLTGAAASASASGGANNHEAPTAKAAVTAAAAREERRQMTLDADTLAFLSQPPTLSPGSLRTPLKMSSGFFSSKTPLLYPRS